MASTLGPTSSSRGPPTAFDAIGQFRFTPREDFDGRKDNFEEFAFTLKSYRFLMDAGYEKALKSAEAISDMEVTDSDFIDESGNPRTALLKQEEQPQCILVSLGARSDSTMLRRDNTNTSI